MAKRYTDEDLKMIERLYNEGFSNHEIAQVLGRTEGSIGVKLVDAKFELNLIDRTEARRLRKLREANTVARVIEIAAQEPQRATVRPKPTIWERMIGFFG